MTPRILPVSRHPRTCDRRDASTRPVDAETAPRSRARVVADRVDPPRSSRAPNASSIRFAGDVSQSTASVNCASSVRSSRVSRRARDSRGALTRGRRKCDAPRSRASESAARASFARGTEPPKSVAMARAFASDREPDSRVFSDRRVRIQKRVPPRGGLVFGCFENAREIDPPSQRLNHIAFRGRRIRARARLCDKSGDVGRSPRGRRAPLEM